MWRAGPARMACVVRMACAWVRRERRVTDTRASLGHAPRQEGHVSGYRCIIVCHTDSHSLSSLSEPLICASTLVLAPRFQQLVVRDVHVDHGLLWKLRNAAKDEKLDESRVSREDHAGWRASQECRHLM